MKNILIIILVFGLLFTFLAITSPDEVSLPLLLVPFIFLAFFIFFLARIFLGVFLKQTDQNGKRTIYSLIISLVVINFIVLSSVGQLTLQDMAITSLITLLAIIYVSKLQLKP